MDFFKCEADWQLGKVLKYYKPNPIGEDAHLKPDGTVECDEDKIISAQRIFKHNYYRADGPWDLKTREKYVSGPSERILKQN
jgi:hypothetical protein